MDKTLTTKKGNYEIKVSDIFNGQVVKDGLVEDVPNNPTFTKVGNAPDTNGFNKSNTYYVAWNLNEAETEYIPNEVIMQNGIAPNNWYDYTEGVNHWANVKTTGGGNDCYWVWIPRYAYRITEGYHTNTAGTIDIKFLQGTTNTPIDGSNIEIKNQTGSGNWNVHPAFWWDENNNGIEDEGEQLTGIWVAKFEASSNASNVVENPTESQLKIDGGSETDTDLQVRVKPNVASWRCITVGNIFTVCRNLTTSGNSLEGTTKLDSHMMKNTEWGAVAYLSRSVYGKNSEVWNNPFNYWYSGYGTITGLCSNESDGKDAETTDITKTCKYNELGGGNASTTGNVYGVFDMAGGISEYVAGILSTYKSMSGYYDFTDSDTYPNKYFDWYNEVADGGDYNLNANADKYGDAAYETSSTGVGGHGSWDVCYSLFPYSVCPVFSRGAVSVNGETAGIFAMRSYNGNEHGNYGFRPVVLSSGK